MSNAQNKSVAVRDLGTRLRLTIEFIERVQDFPDGAALRAIVDEEVAKQRLRSLRILARDVDEMALTLTPAQRKQLQATLEEHSDVDVDAEWNAQRTAMDALVQRGEIRSERERKRVERYLEALIARSGPSSEIRAIRSLLER